VFKITPSGTLTVLYAFGTNSGDGTEPYVGLISGTDGNFYGTTLSGGANGHGTVYKITPSGTMTVLHSFTSTDGGLPRGLVQGSDGRLYGMTSTGGTHNDGTVFAISLQ
jgi:uncharacterized repeat protein (TIGR03803 family)